MHFSKGDIEILALYVFLWISLSLYVCHITHLIEAILISLRKKFPLTFSIDINVPPSHMQKVGFSVLVQQ